MSLSDVVSRAGLSTYAEVALLLFVIAFVAVAVHVFRRAEAERMEHARHLPLFEDGDTKGSGLPAAEVK